MSLRREVESENDTVHDVTSHTCHHKLRDIAAQMYLIFLQSPIWGEGKSCIVAWRKTSQRSKYITMSTFFLVYEVSMQLPVGCVIVRK
jgi:hypothetical protein